MPSTWLPRLVLSLGVVACSASAPKPSTSAFDPSNPDAAEGAPLHAAAPVADPTQAGRPQSEHSDHADHAGHSASKGYVCPMHPEVTDDEASRCPKCGMSLVPAS